MPKNPKIFEKILGTSKLDGTIPNRVERSRTWLREQASSVVDIAEGDLFKTYPERLTGGISIGSMFMFFYGATSNIPYYDAFPLIFPVDFTNDGFYGLNMHYLPPMHRAELMDSLYSLIQKESDESARLRISYDILTTYARFRPFKACFKRYLNENVRSRFMFIKPTEWDIALFLPTERWIGATSDRVYADSLSRIGQSKR